jgi:hypothetical protein
MANNQWADAIQGMPFVQRNTDDNTVLEYRFAKSVGRFQGFTVEPLRHELQLAGFHRPSLSGDTASDHLQSGSNPSSQGADGTTLDWNTVEVRRQQLNFLFNGQLSLALLPQAHDVALVESLGKFQQADYTGVVEHWPDEYRQPTDPVLQLVLAASYAELARNECLELLAAAEEGYPIDVAAVRAIYYWRSGDATKSVEQLERFYTLLADDPWMIPIISETACHRTVDVAKTSPDAAQRLYRHLLRAFASNRFDYIRQLQRIRVAKELGPEAVVEAFADLEPNVTWTAEFLELRADTYASLDHPLARRAARDLQRFQSLQPPTQPGSGTTNERN